MEKLRRRSKKTLVGIVGGTVLIAGLAMIPYPGPGWLVVFGGLAILATEFAFAEKLLSALRAKYDAWTHWLGRQNGVIKVLALLITCAVVVLTVWLLNGFGIARSLLVAVLGIGEEWSWLESPWF